MFLLAEPFLQALLIRCICVDMLTWELKKVLEPVELELQVILSPMLWMLGTELGSPVRAANALNY